MSQQKLREAPSILQPLAHANTSRGLSGLIAQWRTEEGEACGGSSSYSHRTCLSPPRYTPPTPLPYSIIRAAPWYTDSLEVDNQKNTTSEWAELSTLKYI